MSKPAGAMPTGPATSPAMMAAAPPAAGPYDPNGYRPEVAAQAAAQAEDRYASAANSTAAAAYGDFESFMAKGATQASSEANRYASAAGQATASVAGAPNQASAAVASATKALPQVAPATAYPATPYPTSAYPTTSASAAVATVAGAKPVASPIPSAVIGTLPSANLAPVQLASKPGQYRPGSTRTYRPGVSVATLPPASSAPAATPLPRDASGLPVYPTTTPAPAPTQLR
jgi:hypothetical protein